MNKLQDGQLDGSPLTLRDLRKIEDAFFQVAAGIFHKRPVLPKVSKQGEGQKAAANHLAAQEEKPEEEGTRITSGKGWTGGDRNDAKSTRHGEGNASDPREHAGLPNPDHSRAKSRSSEGSSRHGA
jgi:hypothetical protein